jgi:hypothetical protein
VRGSFFSMSDGLEGRTPRSRAEGCLKYGAFREDGKGHGSKG